MSSAGTKHAAVDHRSVGLLGILTICAYGCWYYAFGVLLDPILDDTDWRESTLAASFSAGTVLIGVASLAGGRMLDRVGHRAVFLLGGVLTLGGMLVASWATSSAVFFVGAALGLGASGTLGFYHVTMPTAVRLNESGGPRAITVLTIWGAFASAIFLPLTAWLIDAFGWRSTIRILGVIAAAAFTASAVLLPSVPPRDATVAPRPLRAVVAETFSRPDTRWFTAAIAFGGIAMSTMLVYQVPTMRSLGLAAGTASTIAGLRGFCQLLGRLPLTPIVSRLGLDRALIVAFAAVTLAGGLLAVSSTIATGVVFAIVAGFGIGAFSPLQGMKSESLFDRDNLGATMGWYGAVMLLAGSIGPFVAGFIVDQTGERRWAAAIVSLAGAAALLSLLRMAACSTEAVSPTLVTNDSRSPDRR